jgi:hypothetical protein
MGLLHVGEDEEQVAGPVPAPGSRARRHFGDFCRFFFKVASQFSHYAIAYRRAVIGADCRLVTLIVPEYHPRSAPRGIEAKLLADRADPQGRGILAVALQFRRAGPC